nr:tol-pal system-associated acyl-CoA thioesterase [Aurantimonas sp. CSK15Z-1]
MNVRVYFEDTDFSGVVYHARYLHFMERARTDFLRLRGIDHRTLAAGGFGEPMAFAVRHMDIDFLRPARIDDILEVRTETLLLGGARIVLGQEIRLGATTLVTAKVKVAVISPEGKPRRMPERVMAVLGAASAAPQQPPA